MSIERQRFTRAIQIMNGNDGIMIVQK